MDKLLKILWNDSRVLDLAERSERMLSYLVTPGSTILDIGCAYGRLKPVVEAAGGIWTGWDKDPTYAQEGVIIGDCLKGDDPFAGVKFNLVVGCMMCTPLRLTHRQFRDRFIYLCDTPGQVVLFEACETYIWHRYTAELDDAGEAIRKQQS